MLFSFSFSCSFASLSFEKSREREREREISITTAIVNFDVAVAHTKIFFFSLKIQARRAHLKSQKLSKGETKYFL